MCESVREVRASGEDPPVIFPSNHQRPRQRQPATTTDCISHQPRILTSSSLSTSCVHLPPPSSSLSTLLHHIVLSDDLDRLVSSDFPPKFPFRRSPASHNSVDGPSVLDVVNAVSDHVETTPSPSIHHHLLAFIDRHSSPINT